MAWPILRRRRALWLVASVFVLGVAGALAWHWFGGIVVPADERLAAFVHARPPVPIVFTSRTETASLRPASPKGEGFHWPGQGGWQAREGRLRLLTPKGTVHELTWGRPLPDGSTLIDVMSPSISPDGDRVVFAGRKATAPGEPPARFRLYSVGVDGRDLKQLTGGPDDEGCTELPPLRYGPDDKLLDPDTRKRIDYDDIDPIVMADESVIFASSRIPDLGSQHARRATMLWRWDFESGRHTPYSSNRYNDRWPFELLNHRVVFSLWSRNQEVVAENGRDVAPWDPAHPGRTSPSDAWSAMTVQPEEQDLRILLKLRQPVWRPRPLFDGRIAFMSTPAEGPADPEGVPVFRVAQATESFIGNAPSSLARTSSMPKPWGSPVLWLASRDKDGQAWSHATPSPCPTDQVLLAAAPVAANDSAPPPGAYGIYLTPQAAGWSVSPTDAGPVELQKLFDDPEMVDAEPVAVYTRPVLYFPWSEPAKAVVSMEVPEAIARSGLKCGFFEDTQMGTDVMSDMPGQRTDRGDHPIFPPPPKTAIREMAVYSARRDRFDDPERSRVPGAWELLTTIPIKENSDHFQGWVPVGAPVVLAGRDAEGKVVRWQSEAKDSEGRQATFYALAGDHYSSPRPNGYHFCIGCHTGHSTNHGVNSGDVAERVR
jgi:hypothetical protein